MIPYLKNVLLHGIHVKYKKAYLVILLTFIVWLPVNVGSR
jgi:hypothetical protein